MYDRLMLSEWEGNQWVERSRMPTVSNMYYVCQKLTICEMLITGPYEDQESLIVLLIRSGEFRVPNDIIRLEVRNTNKKTNFAEPQMGTAEASRSVFSRTSKITLIFQASSPSWIFMIWCFSTDIAGPSPGTKFCKSLKYSLQFVLIISIAINLFHSHFYEKWKEPVQLRAALCSEVHTLRRLLCKSAWGQFRI